MASYKKIALILKDSNDKTVFHLSGNKLLLVVLLIFCALYVSHLDAQKREKRSAVIGMLSAQALSYMPFENCADYRKLTNESVERCEQRQEAVKRLANTDEFKSLVGLSITASSNSSLSEGEAYVFEDYYEKTTELLTKMNEKEPTLDVELLNSAMHIKDKFL